MSDLIETVARYDMGQLIFWAGAGISAAPPAAVPLGGSMTRFVLDTACGEEASQRLLTLWENAQRLCNKHYPTIPFPSLPRLESILNAVAKAENVAGSDLSVIAGLGSLRDVPPNVNHLLLASLVLRGASVVTTNFDMAVQSGIRVIEPSVDVVSSEEETPGLFRQFHLRGASGAGSVIHVHGTADFPTELGATLQQVKKGLDPAAMEWLDGRLRAGAVLVFVGYSASDAFDVTPWFGRQEEGGWAKSAMVFVQHGSDPIPSQTQELGKGFPVKVSGNGDTSEFLKALVSLAGIQPRSPGPVESFDWRSRFHAAMNGLPGSAARALATCTVCNELGINVDIADEEAYAKAVGAYGDADIHPVHKIFPLAARGRGKPREELERLKREDPEKRALLYFYTYWGRFRRAARVAFPVAKILREGNGNGEISWMPYISMTVHVRSFLEPYLAVPPQAPPPVASLEQLLEVTRLLAGRDLADLQALHQVSIAHRSRLLLEATQGIIDQKVEEQVLRQYAEQSLLQGYTGCWRDFALCRILLLRGGADHDGNLATEARAMLDAADELPRAMGDDRAQRLAARNLRLLEQSE